MLEAPANVLVRRLVQVLLDVVEGVLRHVRDARVGVLPHRALLGHHLAGEELDHGGLADAVGSDAPTRDASDTCTVASFTVGSELTGYV